MEGVNSEWANNSANSKNAAAPDYLCDVSPAVGVRQGMVTVIMRMLSSTQHSIVEI